MFNPDRKYLGIQHDLLVCACSDPQHQIVFTQYNYGSPVQVSEVYMYTHLKLFPFWKRLKVGIQYIFGKQSKYGAFDDVLLTTKEMDQLGKIVENFKKGLE